MPQISNSKQNDLLSLNFLKHRLLFSENSKVSPVSASSMDVIDKIIRKE